MCVAAFDHMALLIKTNVTHCVLCGNKHLGGADRNVATHCVHLINQAKRVCGVLNVCAVLKIETDMTHCVDAMKRGVCAVMTAST